MTSVPSEPGPPRAVSTCQPANDLTPGPTPPPPPHPHGHGSIAHPERSHLLSVRCPPGPLPPSCEGSGFSDLTLIRNLIRLILRGMLHQGHPLPRDRGSSADGSGLALVVTLVRFDKERPFFLPSSL